MSLRYFSNVNLLSVLPTFVLGIGVCGAAQAASGDASSRLVPPIENYANQVFPTPKSQDYYNSPLAAGTLTLQDVLDAHKPNDPQQNTPPSGTGAAMPPTAPLLAPPKQTSSPSSAGLMMSQGMKAVLQDVGKPTVAPVHVRVPPVSTDAVAQENPVALVPPTLPATAAVAATAVQYQPGQEPKSLTGTKQASPPAPIEAPAALALATIEAPAATTDTAATAPAKVCDENVQKWEKACGDAGYPSTYVGSVLGETRTNCTDGTLHDMWVTNSCVPPAEVVPPAQTAKTDALCGAASNNEYETAPSADLCAQGIASAVNGAGPWTWACSGINGGTATSCLGHKLIPARDGACGSANGAAVEQAPSTELCTVGIATSVKGSGPWTWICKGVGKGNSQSCIASVVAAPAATPAPAVAETVAPAIPEAAPAAAVAVQEPVAASHETPAPAHVTATAEKNELCGAASETLAYEAPEKDLCRAGVASVVNGDGPWTWSCTDNEGSSSTCATMSIKSDATPVASAEAQAPKSAPQAPVTATVAAPAPAPVSAPDPAPSQHTLKPPHTLAPPAIVQPVAPPVAPPVAIAPPPVKYSCGFATTLPTKQAPTAGLCEQGTSSAVYGKGPWRWVCGKGSAKVSCEAAKTVDASCGSANGMALNFAPAFGLCATGETSAIQGNGPWTWSCKGISGGASASCAASMLTPTYNKVDGACGSSDKTNLNEAPTSGLCASGTPSAVNTNGGSWIWSCSGTDDGVAASCQANKIVQPKPPGPLVNGLCGAANGAIAAERPADALCTSGKVSSVVGYGPWNWNCVGENGGMTVSCTAPMTPPEPIDGDCGSASGVPTALHPQSGLCAAGISGTVNGNGPWTWTCSGVNGGSPASCIAPVTGRTGAIPSLMTTSRVAAPAPVAPPTRLVTPHLPPASSLPSLVSPSMASTKAFAAAPLPTPVPPVANMVAIKAPDASPTIPEGMTPLQPPTVQGAIPTAPALQPQQDSSGNSHVPGNSLTLDPSLSVVLFAHGSGNIGDDMTGRLDKLANVLQSNPDVRVSLYAYADNSDMTPRDARHLSLTRALAIRDYLSAKDIDQSRIDLHAEGANTSKSPRDRIDVKVNN